MNGRESGPLGCATRIDAGRREVDAWSISLVNPITVVAPVRGYPVGQMRSQFLLSLHRIDQMTPEPTGRTGDSHTLVVSVASPTVMAARVESGIAPGADVGGVLRACFPGGPGDLAAKELAQLTARAIVLGELPMQGRNVALAFYRGVRLMALAVHGFSRISPVESGP